MIKRCGLATERQRWSWYGKESEGGYLNTAEVREMGYFRWATTRLPLHRTMGKEKSDFRCRNESRWTGIGSVQCKWVDLVDDCEFLVCVLNAMDKAEEGRVLNLNRSHQFQKREGVHRRWQSKWVVSWREES